MVIALSYNTVNIKWEAQTRDYGCAMHVVAIMVMVL